jgi:cell division septation protein DedD
MRKLLVSYLRFVAFSVVALGLSACARMQLSDPTLFALEPKLGEPPEAGAMIDKPADGLTDEQRIEALEAQMEVLGANVANIRRALEVMGPLPDPHAGLVAATLPEAAKPRDPVAEAANRQARLYALPPVLGEGRSLFYEAELGSFRSKAAAEAGWSRLAKDGRLTGLAPRYSFAGTETRLSVGPLASRAAVDALCVELSALAGACRVVAPVRAY